MRKRGYQPASVLSSTATRAMETAELLMPALGNAAEIRYDRALYLAEWPQLLAAIRDAATGASPLLVVGHNPGLEQLALALAQQPKSAAERARRERLVHKFPTAGLAVLDFPGSDWSEIKLGTGRLVDYIRPKDLDGEAGDA
jgi:phosphohistidine phosphatase